ncbi:DUF5819 family protein [Streptomyces seoulensis]
MDAQERGSNGPGGRYGPDRGDEPRGAHGTHEVTGATEADATVGRDTQPAGAAAVPGPRAEAVPVPGAEAVSGVEPPARAVPGAAGSGAEGARGAEAGDEPGAGVGNETVRGGVAALSLPYRVGAALAFAVVAVVACVHLAMVFLYVTPSNTVTRQYGKNIDGWIYPEFEQNWKLFAPNPLQQNMGVQVRAETRGADGGYRTTGWYDLSAEDGRTIDANPVPSHTQQNELRRAFDFYASTHDGDNRTTGLRGALAEQYLRRIVVLRLGRDRAAGPGGALQRVQVRLRTTNVPAPRWSTEKVSTSPTYRMLPWWTVPADEARGGVR